MSAFRKGPCCLPETMITRSPLSIEEGAWIGAQAMVCPGIVCGNHAVLAAGSVATRDLEPYKIYQGNPAVFIKERIIR